jgi:hypothetical protein
MTYHRDLKIWRRFGLTYHSLPTQRPESILSKGYESLQTAEMKFMRRTAEYNLFDHRRKEDTAGLNVDPTFGPKREEVAGGWRKLRKEELHA